jgi:secreted PhoX family phosphatase
MQKTIRRRDFVRTGALAAGALAFGPGFWKDAFATHGQPGPGPYGPLGPPDANGLMLPAGFKSRVVARGNLPVEGTTHVWHVFPDGAATYATGDGGWILVSNCEAPAQFGGGAEAIRFNRNGGVRSAYRILGGTNTNCAGGPTPWGTWLSCEEVGDGRVWECDPTGARPAVVRPQMGVFEHEAVAVEPDGSHAYLTEDVSDGGWYRFTAATPGDFSAGTLEIAVVGAGGAVTWVPVPDPLTPPIRHQVPGYTRFRRGEGTWFDSGKVYVCTTSDSKIHAYDTATQTIEVIYNAADHMSPPLTGVDNITVAARSGDIFVCEDNGQSQLDLGLITPEHTIARFLTATGDQHRQSELAGVVFNPAGNRMYFSSQRSFGFGATYEIRGPFR